jgi:RimJ/RimL family protein N-acetyltransferase
MIPRKVHTLLDREAILDHFKNDIQGHDRYLRFGYMASDENIEKYIDHAFEEYGSKNSWFIVEDGNKVIATCHVSLDDSGQAEMGFTVNKDYRGKKIGQQLFFRGMTWACMKGVSSIYTHCLSENAVMQHIARKNDMTVVTLDVGEREATIKATKNQLQSYYEDKFMDNLAFIDKLVGMRYNFFKTTL